jgi:hypothetical protein
MATFWKAAPWISRVILVPFIAIFTMIAVRHLAHPAAMAAQQGLAFVSPVGPTVFRSGFAGFPLGCAVFLAYCILSKQRTLTGLIFSLLLVGIVLAVRVYSMNVDASVPQSMTLVKDESVLVAVSIIGIALEFGGRAYASRVLPSSKRLTKLS